MNIEVEKTKGRIASSSREVKTLKVYVGSQSVRTNDKNSRRGQASVRLITQDSLFVILQPRAMVQAGLETGKYYELGAMVDTLVRRDGTQRVEVAEILSTKEVKAFKFEARIVTYVRPVTEEAPAPSID